MPHKKTICEVVDFLGDRWSAYETRPTNHGWAIFLGKPAVRNIGQDRRGGNRVILTPELVQYMESIRYKRGANPQLPICSGAIKRVRKILGFNMDEDRRSWWEEHADELASMTEVEFAAKHELSPSRVSQVNKAMFGKRIREPNWWRQESVQSLLLSNLPAVVIAEQLGITTGSVRRLRSVSRASGSDDIKDEQL